MEVVSEIHILLPRRTEVPFHKATSSYSRSALSRANAEKRVPQLRGGSLQKPRQKGKKQTHGDGACDTASSGLYLFLSCHQHLIFLCYGAFCLCTCFLAHRPLFSASFLSSIASIPPRLTPSTHLRSFLPLVRYVLDPFFMNLKSSPHLCCLLPLDALSVHHHYHKTL